MYILTIISLMRELYVEELSHQGMYSVLMCLINLAVGCNVLSRIEHKACAKESTRFDSTQLLVPLFNLYRLG